MFNLQPKNILWRLHRALQKIQSKSNFGIHYFKMSLDTKLKALQPGTKKKRVCVCV